MSENRFKVSKADTDGTKESKETYRRVNLSTDIQVNIIEPSPERKANKQANLVAGKAGNLALYEDEIHKRPRISTLLESLSRYEAVASPQQDDEEGEAKTAKSSQATKMGTLMGVYLPTIQNIFGVILFIRLSWIVGIAGTLQAFFIVFICCCCTMLTAISMSAIATNGVVPAGGAYFMISRALGPEFGGAVGLLFYLGTTFASSMYILGAIEILLTYMAPSMSLFGDVRSGGGAQSPVMLNNMRVYGSILLLLLIGVVFVGVKYVNKCASLFLACVLFSILAIYLGFFSAQAREMPRICLLGDKLLASSSYNECSRNDTLLNSTYGNDNTFWKNNPLSHVVGVPGITSGVFVDNWQSQYLKKGEVSPDVQAGKYDGEVRSDITTSFFILLAIFFPSVTGIMAGSNRSGDLRDAQQSIPKGTIAAITTTSVVYLTSVLLFGATVHGELLRDKFGRSINSVMVVAEIAWPPTKWVILIGSLLSTVGAGMQSLTGAPRLLQAIAKDNLIPFLNIFASGSKSGEPTRALMLTACISEIGILIANLDSVAPIITMFFLMCYGFVNLACVLQSLLRTPNWRPRFKYYHWCTSFLGMCLCLALMFISSWYYALVAMILAAAIYKYIEFQGAKIEWGDGFRGLALSAARYSLLRLEEGQPHTKNWRPQILVLCPLKKNFEPESKRLLSLASQLKHGRGLTIVGSILEGDFNERVDDVALAKEVLNDCMKEEKVKGFMKVIVASTASEGISFLAQSSGLGGLEPNTLMITWPENWRERSQWKSFVHTIRCVSKGQEALLVARNTEAFPSNTERLEGNVDVWWIVHDGGLMILILFLLKQHKVWRKCNLRIFTVAQLEDNSIQMKKDLESFMYQLRIKAQVEVIEMTDQDISEYTYERTLLMEQRHQMLREMQLSRKESKREIQDVVEHSYRRRSLSGRRSNSEHKSGKETEHTSNSENESSVAGRGASTSDNSAKSTEKTPTLSDVETKEFGEDKSKANTGYSTTPENEFVMTNFNKDGLVDKNTDVDKVTDGGNASDTGHGQSAADGKESLRGTPKEKNLRRMNTAVKLNQLVKDRSTGTQLLVINLPGAPADENDWLHYMEFLDELTEGLDRVLMVRGGGREVITIYS
ncbi:hypothetical protein ACROYT_G012103 [Oculina patagonica]